MKEMIFAQWFESKNWGDAINPVLIKFISGQSVQNVYGLKHNASSYLVVGSILEYADRNSVVWGAGYISKDSMVVETPKEILAVRGPLTRRLLVDQGILCPELYGDPALLLPRYYNPKVEKKYELGYIPHYAEWKDKIAQVHKNNPAILTIDLTGNVFKVVDQILSCNRIESSALHGLIIADAYGIPSKWIRLSNKVIGNGFKFKDYYLAKKYIDLDKLLAVCPFKKVKQ